MDRTINQHLTSTLEAPRAMQYIAPPRFQYTPSQREIDFAQLVAAGGDVVQALELSSLVSPKEFASTPRHRLYATACRFLGLPGVQERIDYYRQLHRASITVSAERIQQELACIAFADVADAFDPSTGQAHSNPHDVPRYARAAIKEWKTDKDGITTIKGHDKLKALQFLGDMQGLFNEANAAKAPQVTVNIGDGLGVSAPSPTIPPGRTPLTPENSTVIDITPGRDEEEELPDILL